MLAAGDGVLQKGAAVVADYKGQLDGELAALEGRLAGLKSMWQGQGAAGFDRTFNLWKDDSKKIISALDTFRAMYRMQSLRQQALAEMAQFDVMLLPTAGTIYAIAQVEADPITLNANLGYYTNFVNLFDLCGAAVPAGILPNGVPMGVTLLAAAGHDRRVLGLADTYLKRRNG